MFFYRYKLLDRFKSIVAGFADSYALAADKCKATVKSVSLRVLARVLLDADSLSVDSALERATAAYRIVEHLAQGKTSHHQSICPTISLFMVSSLTGTS